MTKGGVTASAVPVEKTILARREELRMELYRLGEECSDLAEGMEEDDQSVAAFRVEMKPLLSKLQGIYDNLGTTLKGCHAVASVAAIGLFGFTTGWTPAVALLAG